MPKNAHRCSKWENPFQTASAITISRWVECTRGFHININFSRMPNGHALHTCAVQHRSHLNHQHHTSWWSAKTRKASFSAWQMQAAGSGMCMGLFFFSDSLPVPSTMRKASAFFPSTFLLLLLGMSCCGTWPTYHYYLLLAAHYRVVTEALSERAVLHGGPRMPEEQEMNAGRQEEDKDFHLCPCNNLHGCMKSFDHGSVEIPQGKQVESALLHPAGTRKQGCDENL